MIASLLLLALAAYLGLGIFFSIGFAFKGVSRVDPAAAHGTWGFRMLILPGSVMLWPLLARRWLGGTQSPPEERNSHRLAARL